MENYFSFWYTLRIPKFSENLKHLITYISNCGSNTLKVKLFQKCQRSWHLPMWVHQQSFRDNCTEVHRLLSVPLNLICAYWNSYSLTWAKIWRRNALKNPHLTYFNHQKIVADEFSEGQGLINCTSVTCNQAVAQLCAKYRFSPMHQSTCINY